MSKRSNSNVLGGIVYLTTMVGGGAICHYILSLFKADLFFSSEILFAVGASLSAVALAVYESSARKDELIKNQSKYLLSEHEIDED